MPADRGPAPELSEAAWATIATQARTLHGRLREPIAEAEHRS